MSSPSTPIAQKRNFKRTNDTNESPANLNLKRVEFQLRGTPHYHILLSVKHDGIDKTYIESLDTNEKVDAFTGIAKGIQFWV